MTLGRLTAGLQSSGHTIRLFRPRQFRHETSRCNGSLNEQLLPGVRLPMYRDLQLGLPATARLAEAWRRQRPDVVYVATEGPLGWSAVRCAGRLNIPVVSGFHTNFQIYSKHYRLGWLEPVIQRYLGSLHRHTACTLAPTDTLAEQLLQNTAPASLCGDNAHSTENPRTRRIQLSLRPHPARGLLHGRDMRTYSGQHLAADSVCRPGCTVAPGAGPALSKRCTGRGRARHRYCRRHLAAPGVCLLTDR